MCSEKYYDSQYEYRHVVLPPDVAQHLPKGRLLSEPEWRALGVQQSRGRAPGNRDPETHLHLRHRGLRFCVHISGVLSFACRTISCALPHNCCAMLGHGIRMPTVLRERKSGKALPRKLSCRSYGCGRWVHYSIHRPEPHIMLFRRELAPGAAEQVAVMEQEQRRRQIEQQLALHQARSHTNVQPTASNMCAKNACRVPPTASHIYPF